MIWFLCDKIVCQNYIEPKLELRRNIVSVATNDSEENSQPLLSAELHSYSEDIHDDNDEDFNRIRSQLQQRHQLWVIATVDHVRAIPAPIQT